MTAPLLTTIGEEAEAQGDWGTYPGHPAVICTQVIPELVCVTSASLPPPGDASRRNLGSCGGWTRQLPWMTGVASETLQEAQPALQLWSSGSRSHGQGVVGELPS